MARIQVRIDGQRTRAALRGDQAGLTREIERLTRRVEASARRRVGYSDPDPLGRPRRYPHLRDSIRAEVRIRNGVPYGVVVADHPIATIHHNGTKPHVIVPRNAGGRLVFVPRGGTKAVFARKVNHPGTRANRFLTDALRDIR